MADENEPATELEESTDQTPETPATEPDVDSDKTVEKLQKRLGKETAEKKNLQAQLEDVTAKLKDLQEGKNIKELSEDEKAQRADTAKDKKIADLQNELKLSNSKVQTNDVLKEAGLTVSSEMLDLLVSTDDKKTLANVKAFTDYTNGIKAAERKDFMKGNPPHDGGDTKKKPTSLEGMSLTEQSQLMRDDPTLYQQLSQN